MSPTQIGLISFASTIVIVIVLFAVGVLPLWLAAVILVADGAFTYGLINTLERNSAA
jgi:hypothetical protein